MTGAGMLSPVEVVDVEEEVPLQLLGGVGPHAVPALTLHCTGTVMPHTCIKDV